MNFSSRGEVSILVPGAGLARLMFDIAKLGRMDLKKFLVVFSRLNFLFLFGCTCGCIFLKLAKLFFLFLNCLFFSFSLESVLYFLTYI